MKGWGPRLFWFGLGLACFAGCGGRTDSLDTGIYGDDGGGAVSGFATGGSRAGTTGGGARPMGGALPIAGTTPAIGGFPVGGAPFPSTGGVSPVAGTGFGGAISIGGAAPTGGFGWGGFSGFASGGFSGFPSGGFSGFSGAGGSAPVSCQVCLTQACTPTLAQCFQDVGCVAIIGCVLGTGCNPLECYTPGYCKGIIDQFGGPAGPSMVQTLGVVSCAVSSGCQCP